MGTVKYITTPENTKQAMRLFRFCGWKIKVYKEDSGYIAQIFDDNINVLWLTESHSTIPAIFQTAEQAQVHAIVLMAEKMGLRIPGKVSI